MSTSALDQTRWATASHAEPARSQSLEVDSLGAHLKRCVGSRGRWFDVECAGEAVHGFIAPRVVTTLIVAALFIAVGSLLF